ncbi:Uncharacterised protein [Gordonia terrae]|nr:Uncharacterised protein [Gordonia terrae]
MHTEEGDASGKRHHRVTDQHSRDSEARIEVRHSAHESNH